MTAQFVRDGELLASQLGREPRGDVTVVVRCRRGVPQVIRTGPSLPDGSPFPTLFWLTCPALARDVSRLEAEGRISQIQSRVDADPELAGELARAASSYALARLSAGDASRPGAGIGGAADPRAVKCLHAHYAHFLATGDNPVGRIVAGLVKHPDPKTERLCANCRV